MATTLPAAASENKPMMRDAHWKINSAKNRITTLAAEEFTNNNQKDWRTLPLRLERLVHILENWVSFIQ